jgi:hypothetical protein
MGNKTIIGLMVAAIALSSCHSNESKESKEVKIETEKEVSTAPAESLMTVEEINKMRSEIELLKLSPVEVSTTGLREKIKQKWSKIHFYVHNGFVVKVRTYPYGQITKRTEEFYANQDGLLLAVVEDNGEGLEDNDQNEMDKMYYYNNGKLIKELKKEKESEHSIKESDAEELISEFNEYVEIYNKNKR